MKTTKTVVLGLTALFFALLSFAQDQQPRPPEQVAQQIRIPKLEFREASVTEGIDFLKAKARQLAGADKLNIAYIGKKPAAAKVSLSLTDVPLLVVLKVMAHQADLSLKATENGIYLFPKDEKPEL